MNPYEHDEQNWYPFGDWGYRRHRPHYGYSSPPIDHQGHRPGPRGGKKCDKKKAKMAKQSRRRNRR